MLALVFLMTLLPPVQGPVARPFAGGEDPFARGLRRAVVLSGRPGEAVRAPCTGEVRFAGRTPRGPAVTLGCGGRRVTVTPVRASVAAGARVRRGARLGAAAGDVSLSVRAADGAYLAPHLSASPGAPPGALPRRAPPARPGMRRVPRPAVRRPAVRRPAVRPAVRRVPRPAPAPLPPLPWPAWAGAGLLLASASAGIRVRRRRRAGGARRRSLSAQPWIPP